MRRTPEKADRQEHDVRYYLRVKLARERLCNYQSCVIVLSFKEVRVALEAHQYVTLQPATKKIKKL